jgi:DNA-binding CsgD family transcriptional regulator
VSKHCSLAIIGLPGESGAVLIYQYQLQPASSADYERAILSGIPDMVFTLDRGGHYLTFMPAQGMTPFVPPSVFLGKTIEQIMPPEIAGPCKEALELAFSTQAVQTVEYDLIENGTRRSYETRIAVISPHEAMAIVRDVTAGKLRSLDPSWRTESVNNEQAYGGADSYSLSARELMVLELISHGLSDKEVAAALNLKTFTINKYVARILVKMGAASRTEAAVRALREGILPNR